MFCQSPFILIIPQVVQNTHTQRCLRCLGNKYVSGLSIGKRSLQAQHNGHHCGMNQALNACIPTLEQLCKYMDKEEDHVPSFQPILHAAAVNQTGACTIISSADESSLYYYTLPSGRLVSSHHFNAKSKLRGHLLLLDTMHTYPYCTSESHPFSCQTVKPCLARSL